MTIEIGALAPDFTLKDTDGNKVTLSDLRGQSSVTVVFIPFAFTGVCQGELCELRDNFASFETKNNRVLAISCDPGPSQAEWKRAQGYQFPLLSDFWPHGETARSYGCFNDVLGCAERLTVMIDIDGRVTDTFRSGGLGEARPLDNYTDGLAKL